MRYPKKPFLFDCFSPDCGAALITAVAEALSAGLDADQMNVLGNFLTTVADMISYMASQKEFNESTCPKGPVKEDDSGDEDEFLPDEAEEESADSETENGGNDTDGERRDRNPENTDEDRESNNSVRKAVPGRQTPRRTGNGYIENKNRWKT
jgi:hypothetical protein